MEKHNRYTCLIGGTGFIGKYLSTLLLSKGIKVKVIGRTKEISENPEINYCYINTISEIPTRYFDDVDFVVHLAYLGTPKSSFVNPVLDINENLLFSVELLEKLFSTQLKKMIFISSGGTVYGQQLTDNIAEDHRTFPISPYGITKLCIEKYALMFKAINNLPVVIARPSNAYGLGQNAARGQGFIAAVINALKKGESIDVYGKEGTIRDYIHVQDLAYGIYECLQHGELGEIYNIGTGIGTSNKQIIDKIISLTGIRSFKINTLPERPFDVKRNILSIEKLKRLSGWTPQTSLDKGLEEIVESAFSK
jgi:UDP-glucose 4-epimerase